MSEEPPIPNWADPGPKEIRFEGPSTREDYEWAQQYTDKNADRLARTKTQERLSQGGLVVALEQVQKSRIDRRSGLLTNNAKIDEYTKLHRQLNSEQPRAGYPDGAFEFDFDIVDMHGINKKFGNVEGDNAIEAVGKLLRMTFRMDEGDILARGGAEGAASDEFTAVIPYFLHIGPDGKMLMPEEIEELFWRRLKENWMKLEAQGITKHFELLAHCAPVEKGKTLKEIGSAADPKTHLDKAIVFGRTVEPLSLKSKPRGQGLFNKIFAPRH